MRLAYADPPYPGQSAQWYARHPDFAGEVDHAELIGRLEREYDGWALSTSSLALPYVLSLCPTDPPAPGFTAAIVGGVRVAAWHRDLPAPRGTSRLMVTWEPVIVRGGRQLRDDAPGYVWDSLRCPSHVFGRQERISGSKPPRFCRWVFDLLGATCEDTLDDLYPGSGIVGREWEAFSRQSRLAV
jgi:hypothetical protein